MPEPQKPKQATRGATVSFVDFESIYYDEDGRARQVFTTGQIARLSRAAPRTVAKWIDCGMLKGYRIPGSDDRRVELADWIAFCRANNIPLHGYDPEQPDLTTYFISVDIKEFKTPKATRLEKYDSFFDCLDAINPRALMTSQRMAFVFDAGLGNEHIVAFMKNVRKKTPGKLCRAYLWGEMDQPTIDAALKRYGFDGCLQPWEVSILQEKLDEFMADGQKNKPKFEHNKYQRDAKTLDPLKVYRMNRTAKRLELQQKLDEANESGNSIRQAD